jgi:hypothetical protein
MYMAVTSDRVNTYGLPALRSKPPGKFASTRIVFAASFSVIFAMLSSFVPMM